MKKRVKITIILFVICFCINSFAAIVSDNDGSAFLTKSEFDALKQSFAAQVNNYYESIEGKIDGAIASYLAGLKINKTPTNLFKNYIESIGQKPIFKNQLPGSGTSSSKGEVVLNIVREQAVRRINNLGFDYYYYYQSGYAYLFSGLYVNSSPNWSNSISSWTTLWQTTGRAGTTSDSGSTYLSAYGLSTHSAWSSSTSRTYKTNSYANVMQNTVSGQGSGYIYQVLNGTPNLKYYCTSIYPRIVYDIHAHRYKDCGAYTASYYTSWNGKSDTTAITCNPTKFTTYGELSGGTKYTGTSTSNGTYWKGVLSRFDINDGKEYEHVIFPKNSESSVYCYNEYPTLSMDSSTTQNSSNDSYFYDIYYSGNGGRLQTNTMSKVTVNFYNGKYNVEQKKIKDFQINSLHMITGEKVYHGQGFPIIRSESNDTSFDLIMVLNSSAESNISYKISNLRLISNEFDEKAKTKISGTVSKGGKVQCRINNINSGEIVWVNCYADTANVDAWIDSVTIENG